MGNNVDSGGDNMNIAQDQTTAIQTNYSITPQSSVEELLLLLGAVQQELSRLPIQEPLREEVKNEVKEAQRQARKNPPDKVVIAAKLKNAIKALTEISTTITEATTVGSLLGQALVWCRTGCGAAE